MRENSLPGGSPTVTILFEDDLLLVCVKPRGVLSAADASGKRSMADLLIPRTTFPVHRLDREATGLMVFAKDAKTAAFLSAAMGSTFEKEYLALCEGCPPALQGELQDLLYHDRGKNKTYVVKRKRAGVKEARLAYTAEPLGETACLHIRLFTGRTHQIRIQFASRGCPLLGDRKYGASASGPLALYAYRLTFPHPSGKRLCFTLPEEFLPPLPLSNDSR